MDVFSAIVVVVPLILPISEVFGIDPLHLGVIFLANLELGYLTPPVGLNLFLASSRFGKPIWEVSRADAAVPARAGSPSCCSSPTCRGSRSGAATP